MKRPIRIGIAGPVDLRPLSDLIDDPLPKGEFAKSVIIGNLARKYIQLGNSVTIFTLSADPSHIGTFSGPSLKVEVGLLRSANTGRTFFRHERKFLVRAMRQNACDVIHAHLTYEYAWSALSARSAPVVTTIHDWAPAILRFNRDPFRVIRLIMQIFVIARSRHLTANSPYIAERVHRWYRKSVPVIPNGILLDNLSCERPPNLPTDPLIIGSVNNGFDSHKNVSKLIDAFVLIRESRPDSILRLAGIDHHASGPAHSYAASISALEGIEFLGRIPADDVPEFMRSIDVLVHPSLEESFGMVLIEAVASGTLVVAGESSGAVPWVLGGGVAGTLVDVRNACSIAQAVLSLPRGEAESELRRQQAFEYIRDNFSLEAVAQSFIGLFKGVTVKR